METIGEEREGALGRDPRDKRVNKGGSTALPSSPLSQSKYRPVTMR